LQISTGKNDKGLKLYDPGYLNTASVRSTISYIDGDEGILRYRGYPIEELAEKSTFPEVSYLICEYFQKNSCMCMKPLCRVEYISIVVRALDLKQKIVSLNIIK
jgi:hypothetical protein